MTWWTWAAVGLIVCGMAVAAVLNHRESARVVKARIASNIVTELTVAAVLIWALARVIRTQDWLHVGLAVLIAFVVLMSLLRAIVGGRVLFDARDDRAGFTPER
jgi:hypothetical protein